jgi:nicotinate-nucleotide adenylyltransferase
VNPEHWGIFGGVFDPVHYAHLAMAEQVAEALELDRVLFVPAARPVHRPPPVASIKHRVAMLELATAGNERFEISGMEAEQGATGYSVDTVAALAAERPWNSYVFILSVEAAAQLPTWHEPRRLLELAALAVVPRQGHEPLSSAWLTEQFPGLESRFTFVPASELGHSASDIRARVAAGHSIRYLVPPAVAEYIAENGLYGAS